MGDGGESTINSAMGKGERGRPKKKEGWVMGANYHDDYSERLVYIELRLAWARAMRFRYVIDIQVHVCRTTSLSANYLRSLNVWIAYHMSNFTKFCVVVCKWFLDLRHHQISFAYRCELELNLKALTTSQGLIVCSWVHM